MDIDDTQDLSPSLTDTNSYARFIAFGVSV